MKKISRFLWDTGFILPLICFILTTLLIFFPVKNIPKPHNEVLHTIWQLSVFILRPAMFLIPGIMLIIVLFVLHYGSGDQRNYLKEIWRRS